MTIEPEVPNEPVRATFFAQALSRLGTSWRLRDMEAIARMARWLLNSGQLDGLSAKDVAWLARDASALEAVLARRGEIYLVTAKALGAAVLAVIAPIFAYAPWSWKVGIALAAMPVLLFGLLLHLRGDGYQRLKTEVGALAKDLGAICDRKRVAVPYRSSGPRVEVEERSLAAGTAEAQDAQRVSGPGKKESEP
jgi:hypothetical protein